MRRSLPPAHRRPTSGARSRRGRPAGAVLLLTLLVAAATAGPAQTDAAPRGTDDHSPLGGLGVEGDVVTLDKAGQAFKIATVEVGGPAERGGLRAGDVILALGGKTPGDRGDPILALERQIELAESRKDAALEATVLRDGKRMTVTVEVEFLGAHAATCPLQCRKCATVRDRAVRFLADTQNAQGGWETPLGGNNGRIVVATLAGLALHGARKHPEAVRRAVEYVVRTLDAPDPLERLRSEQGANWSQVNWPLAYAPLLLTAMPQEGGAMDALKAIAHKLIDNQEASGGYAHGPGGPNALDYVELEIVSNYALASLGLLRDRGLAVDAAGVDRGLAYIQACMAGDGGVAYSTRPGQAGHGDPGRTAGAFFALDRNGLGNSKAARKMLRYFERGMDTLPAGHVSPMMHLLAGAMAARASGQKGLLRDFWKCYRPYLMASRRHAGAFAARPTRETRLLRSNIDRTLGPAWTTATLALVLDLALDENACPHLFRAPSPRSKS